ncbi:C-signal-like [Pluvialis apricaria]
MAALARSVLVTGSNRGIGLELVRQLAASPQPPEHIFATCRDPEGPRGKALRELAAQHPSIKLVQLDTVNVPSIRGAVRAVGSHLKDQGLNLLINNAGVSSHATLRSLDSQEMLSVFATNVVGPLQVAKEFLPLLEKAAKGAGKEGLSCSRAAVINVSTKLGSIGLCLGVPEAPMYPYRASKAAQNMVTRCMAAELQDKGILCTAIHPGWVKTDMGTEKAPLMVEQSVRGILTVLASLAQDTSGTFLDWEGKSLPW